MNAPGVWAGLSDSVFLADVDDRERDAWRFARALLPGYAVALLALVFDRSRLREIEWLNPGGFIAALAAAFASLILVIIAYALLMGEGARGARAIGDVAAMINNPQLTGFDITIAREVAATVVGAVFFLVFVAMAALALRRPLHAFVTAAAQVRWRLFALSLALAALVLSPAVIVERMADAQSGAPPLLAVSSDPAARIIYGLSALLLIPAAAAEELIFRGWLTRQVSGFLRRPAMIIGVPAVLFAAAHLDFNPDAFLTRALMGAGFGYMTLRLGGIEFSSGVHAVNNMLIVLFVQPLSMTVSEPSDLSALSLIEDLFLVGGYVVITEAVARIPLLRRLAGVRLEDLSPVRGVRANFG